MTDFQDLHFEQAVSTFDRGDLEESIEHYRKAIERQPDDASLHFNLALALNGAGDLQGAEEEFREAVRLDPMDARLHYGLGTNLFKTEQWDQAVISFRQAAQLQPGYPVAMQGAAVALGRKAKASDQTGDHRAYLEAVVQMISLLPEDLSWRDNQGWALWRIGRRSEALAVAEEMLSLEPTSRRYSRLLFYQRRLGRWRDFLRTNIAMMQFEFQRAMRRQEWQENGAEARKPKSRP